MKAIILAAGVGKRIGAATGNRPKCLLEFGGRSLLVRYLDALLAVGVKSAVLVVGHRQELIRDAVGENYRGLAIRYVVNDQYHRGRSEEHTSELQSRLHLVCRLLLEKKKKIKIRE